MRIGVQFPPGLTPGNQIPKLVTDPGFGEAEIAYSRLVGARIAGARGVQISVQGAKYRLVQVGDTLQNGDWLVIPAGSDLIVERRGVWSLSPEKGMPRSAAKTGTWFVVVVDHESSKSSGAGTQNAEKQKPEK